MADAPTGGGDSAQQPFGIIVHNGFRWRVTCLRDVAGPGGGIAPGPFPPCARRRPAGLRATGPAGHAVNAAMFAALYATPWYAPQLAFTSDAALIFYGASMLLAAARSYAGCEVLAVSNWLLRRDDQVGCVLFAPVDALEHRR